MFQGIYLLKVNVSEYYLPKVNLLKQIFIDMIKKPHKEISCFCKLFKFPHIDYVNTKRLSFPY